MADTQRTEKEEFDELLQSAIESSSPKFYCNGFANGLGNTDVILALFQNRSPICTINMSYITAKSLALKLAELIQTFEAKTDSVIPTTDAVDIVLKDNSNNKK